MIQKTIHLALALPGSGKTHNFLCAAKKIISSGKKILYALPTIPLADAIMERLPTDLQATRVDSSTRAKANVVRMLNDALMPNSGETFVICQHATLHKCSTEHLKDWILVVDETPAVLSLKHHTFKLDQFNQIKYIECVDGEVRIKAGMRHMVQDELQSYKSSRSNTSTKTASTLSDDVHDVYDALHNDYPVFVDDNAINDISGQSRKNRTIRIIHERDFFPRFAAAQETHLLTATVDGSVFDYYRKLNEHVYTTSVFTPPTRNVFPSIRIFPMLSQGTSFSKSLVNAESELQPNIKNLSVMINSVKTYLGNNQCLLFTHKWAQNFYGSNIIVCDFDSRGIDTLKFCDHVFVAIHGNPTPPERRSLEFLAKSHGTKLPTMLRAWEVTYKLEITLQDVFRSSLRSMYRDDGTLSVEPENKVFLFVQDYATVEYLKQYLPEAIVDGSLAKSYRETKPKGRTSHPSKEKMIRMIKEGFGTNEIMAETRISRTTICKERLSLAIPSRRSKLMVMETANNPE
ncbi:DEAD/DEAH box helicase [Pseudomonas sp. GZD-222]|uniref:DEAD/DEAH box helicase n=1 Tax=Pseudomonas sp. GZD-222 TaxID=3404805 RepID=UPI003BB774F3